MSYDISLVRTCDNKIIQDDQITDSDANTIILNRPVANSNVTVRINDFIRPENFQTELLIREDVSDKNTGTNSTYFVKNGPIYDGLKIGQLATRKELVVVRVKVTDEDVSEQFTGIENYFVTQGKPLLRSSIFDFVSIVEKRDFIVTVNGTPLTEDDIADFDAIYGRVQLKEIPPLGATVTVTYYYRAKIKELDAINSKIVIKEKPEVGQETKIAYFSQQSDGWLIQKSQRSLVRNAKDVVFFRPRATNRVLVQNEDVSAQFAGTESSFYTMHRPILPLFQNFANSFLDTLYNAVTVFIDGVREPIASLDSASGYISLNRRPQKGEQVLVTYYYQNELIPDRISVDYYVDSTFCPKCSDYSDVIDYSIDKLGQYKKVINEYKLMQDLKKIIITILGSDPVAKWYGTSFDTLIGSKQFPEILKTKLASEIYKALTKLKNTQIQQSEYQTVTDNEMLDYIEKIEVVPNTSDVSQYDIAVTVITQSGRPVTATSNVTI